MCSMSNAERPPGPNVQQCPSCGSTAVQRLSIVESGRVWLVCGRCDLRWSIGDRRSPGASDYRGFERRRPLLG
jgi:transcription elongation factor Elf1